MQQPALNFRIADSSEDALIAEHFYQMWRDNEVPESAIRADWLKVTLQFIDRARQTLCYQAFVAEVDDRVVGSTSCQLFAGLYPHILTADYQHSGYIWGVYVEPVYRKQGLGKQLMSLSVAYLKSIGCTRAILNASPSGKPVYTSLGFLDANEMRLELKDNR